MPLTVPAELEGALQELARWRGVAVEQILREAITEYLEEERAFAEELAGWQALGAEALERVERESE